MFYQSQAENPSVTHTPAGDPCNIIAARLIAADAFIFQAAHLSRAECLADWIDPSVLDENDPDQRDVSLDLYHPDNKPPYSDAFMARFRAAQLERMRRRTVWVRDKLAQLRKRGGLEMERGFVTHRTMADPRFLDGAIDPNGRPIGSCFMGIPETVNTGPVGLARFSTLRSWLSQWSLDDTNAHGRKSAAHISVPLLALEHGADDAVPQPHTRIMFEACASADKTMLCLEGATHYFAGQPELLAQAAETCVDWMQLRGLID